MIRSSQTVAPGSARAFDPEFVAIVETCMRLSRGKAALEERVERLEVQLEDHLRDEQARFGAEQAEAEFQRITMAGEFAERLGGCPR